MYKMLWTAQIIIIIPTNAKHDHNHLYSLVANQITVSGNEWVFNP